MKSRQKAIGAVLFAASLASFSTSQTVITGSFKGPDEALNRNGDFQNDGILQRPNDYIPTNNPDTVPWNSWTAIYSANTYYNENPTFFKDGSNRFLPDGQTQHFASDSEVYNLVFAPPITITNDLVSQIPSEVDFTLDGMNWILKEKTEPGTTNNYFSMYLNALNATQGVVDLVGFDNITAGIEPWRSFKDEFYSDQSTREDIRLRTSEGDLFVTVDVRIGDYDIRPFTDTTVTPNELRKDSFVRAFIANYPAYLQTDGQDQLCDPSETDTAEELKFGIDSIAGGFYQEYDRPGVLRETKDALGTVINQGVELDIFHIGKANNVHEIEEISFANLVTEFPWQAFRQTHAVNNPDGSTRTKNVDWEIQMETAKQHEWRTYQVNLTDAFLRFGPGSVMNDLDDLAGENLPPNGCRVDPEDYYTKSVYAGFEFSPGIEFEMDIDNFYISRGAPITKDHLESSSAVSTYKVANATGDVDDVVDGDDNTFYSIPAQFSSSNPLGLTFDYTYPQWVNAVRLVTDNEKRIASAEVFAWDDANSEFFDEPVLVLNKFNSFSGAVISGGKAEIEFLFSPVETSKIKIEITEISDSSGTTVSGFKTYSANLFWHYEADDLGSLTTGGDVYPNIGTESPSLPLSNMVNNQDYSVGQIQNIPSGFIKDGGNPVSITVDLGEFRRFNEITIDTHGLTNPPYGGYIRDIRAYVLDAQNSTTWPPTLYYEEDFIGERIAIPTSETTFTIPTSTVMSRYIVLEIGRCTTINSEVSSQWVQIEEIDVNRIGYDVTTDPLRRNFAHTDLVDQISTNVTPTPLESDLRKMIDGDSATLYQFQQRPIIDGPVKVDFKFDQLREIDHFAFGTADAYTGVPRHFKINYKKPGSSSWTNLVEVTDNREQARGVRLPRVTTREVQIEVLDCDRHDNIDDPSYVDAATSSEDHWVNFTWFQIYNFDAGFMDNTWDRDPSAE